MTDDAIFINDRAAEATRLRLLAVPRVKKAFTYPYRVRGHLLGWRVFAVGLTPGYGNTAKPVTEADLRALAGRCRGNAA